MSNPDLAWAESVPTTNELYFTLVYILILVYCCFGLAVICDVYFVPALQKLSFTYNLPPDIAGSTLMAMGASVPELFASLIGVFITEDDIGTGSIIGSSCFNLIAVPAVCAFVASASFSRKLNVKPLPVTRNSAFYAITILVLILIIKDNKVDMLESLILLLFFIMYMAFMIISVRAKRSDGANLGSGFSCLSLTDHDVSLTQSYTSADSAIAECDLSPRNKLKSDHQSKNQNHYHDKLTIGVVGDASAFGHLIYIDAENSNNIINTGNKVDKTSVDKQLEQQQQQHQQHQQLRQPNETSPLVLAASNQAKPARYSDQAKPLLFNYYSYNKVYDTVAKDHRSSRNGNSVGADSVSVDIGLAIKNSASLAVINRAKLCDSFRSERVDFAKDKSFDEESDWVKSIWILVPMFPLTLGMKVLMPCKFKTTCCTLWTFIMSIALIGGLTYVSVWMVHMISDSFGIPDTVAGMTILSWGTGIPELIASVVLIRKTAQADMAICNTIGSNVIDVSFCLSVPWMIKCIILKSQGLEPVVEVQSAALPWTSFLLIISVVALIIVLKLHDWTLSFSVGFWLTLVYALFVLSATLLEMKCSESGLDLLALF